MGLDRTWNQRLVKVSYCKCGLTEQEDRVPDELALPQSEDLGGTGGDYDTDKSTGGDHYWRSDQLRKHRVVSSLRVSNLYVSLNHVGVLI